MIDLDPRRVKDEAAEWELYEVRGIQHAAASRKRQYHNPNSVDGVDDDTVRRCCNELRDSDAVLRHVGKRDDVSDWGTYRPRFL